MRELEAKLGYTFHDRTLLEKALTHSSYANEAKRRETECNERLEFLGDAVLGLVVADWLYRNCPHVPEGRMTRTRAELVCENSLAETSTLLGIGEYLRLGKGEDHGGGRTRKSILADAFEATLAAVYLDGGMENAERIVRRLILSKLEDAPDPGVADYKTRLQERLQGKNGRTVAYEMAGEEGPDHDKRFTAVVLIDGEEAGRGTGRNKKEAEQSAAREALEKLRP